MSIVKLLRLHSPAGIFPLLWPCLWSLTLASKGMIISSKLICLFVLGAVVMRAFGCVINDMWDRDLDRQVERTKSRPLASGALKIWQAVIVLFLLGCIGLLILLQFNNYTIWLGISVLPLVALYPLMKRITNWPQLFLGLVFNWGALLGWSAVRGQLGLAPVVLYAAGVFWTLAYDTIYAFQDIEDDMRVGIGSSARAINNYPRTWLACFYGCFFGLLFYVGFLCGCSLVYYVTLIAAALFASYCVSTLDPSDAASNLQRFQANAGIGGMVWAAILLTVD